MSVNTITSNPVLIEELKTALGIVAPTPPPPTPVTQIGCMTFSRTVTGGVSTSDIPIMIFPFKATILSMVCSGVGTPEGILTLSINSTQMGGLQNVLLTPSLQLQGSAAPNTVVEGDVLNLFMNTTTGVSTPIDMQLYVFYEVTA